MCSARKPSLTRLLGTRNAADLNVLLDSELSLSGNIVETCKTVLTKFTEFLEVKLKEADGNFKEIIIGGSLGTRTEINSEDDIDVTCHVMLDYGDNELTENIGKFKESLPGVVQFINKCLEEYGDEIVVDDLLDERIDCTLKMENCPIDVELEIIPSFYWDNEDDEKREKLYNQMINNSVDRRFYTTSLCALQINYVKDKNNRVRNLIRLAKFWRERAFAHEKEDCRWPSVNMLQILVISLWERAGRPETFKPSVGFREVMEAIQNYANMYIVPTVYFTKDKFHRAMLNPRNPVIIDPCDPTRNHAGECNCWNDVAGVAAATLGKPMLQDVAPNPRWQ